MASEYLAQRAGQLQAERVYWEGVRRNANLRLGEIEPSSGMYTDNVQEQIKAQLSAAVFHLEEIAQELNRIREQQAAEARETAEREQAQREQQLKEQDSLQHETALKEQQAIADREKAEAIQKEELIKAEALEKERQEKEFFEKKEAERLEALAKEEREKQEAIEKEELEKQEAQQKAQSELDYLAEQLADIDKEWQYAQDQIASEWDYVDKQVHEEMEYNVGQTLDVVAEVGFEIGLALANPVSQKEAGEFLEAQKQQLADFISDEVFQAASAEYKEKWLAEKFDEQLRAEAEKFGDRKDDWGNREKLLDAMSELQRSAMEAVQREQEIEKKLQAELQELKRVEAETKERMEKAALEKEILEEKTRQAEELAKKLEDQLREQAEKERQAIWEREQRLMQQIEEQKREEAAREEARRREEAARAMRDAFSY